MGREIFGTDGIRGPAGQYPLDQAGVRQIGKAIAAHFAQPGHRLLVGRDPRQSSPELEAALVAGIISMGVDVGLVGIIPTPGLAYLTKATASPAGVMITASHNPYTDNGIKVFSSIGSKLDDAIEAELNRLIGSDLPDTDGGTSTNAEELIKEYENFLISSADGIHFDKWHLGIDCANGATSFMAAEVFERLNATVTTISNQPDGENINQDCGATHPESLQKLVKDQELDVGVAFDGDGDRVVLIDAQGRLLTGDHMLYILAVCHKQPGVVATSMSNMGLEIALKNHGINLTRTAVGDRYVLEGLEQAGLKLGGEQSGHIILTDYSATGDGLLAAIQTLKAVDSSGKSLADWYDELTLLPQALINITLNDKTRLDQPTAQAFIQKQIEQLDGKARVLVRASGTEPLARVMVEAPDAQQLAVQIASELQELLRESQS